MTLEGAFGSLFVFFSLSLLPWAGYRLGSVDGKSAAFISILVGLLSGLWAVIFLYPLSAAAAAAAGSFAVAFISAGWHVYNDIDTKGHGLMIWTLAGVFAILSYQFTDMATPYLTASVWSFVVLLFLIGGESYFGTPAWKKAFGVWALLVGVFVTGIYGMLLALGVLGF